MDHLVRPREHPWVGSEGLGGLEVEHHGCLSHPFVSD
jgi:hypothetical protein